MRPEPEPDPRIQPASSVDWRRNLVALWIAEFMAIFGFSFCFPVLPIFLHRTLGIADQRELAIWTGLAIGASGVAMAGLSPVWGALADRRGRKPMLLRAMLGGAITVGLVGFAQTALQVVGLRFLQGATSGTVAAANSLMAAETPRSKLGWAFGVLNASIAISGAVAPAAGGLAVAVMGPRSVFWAGGLLLLASVLPVLAFVRESPRLGAGATPALGFRATLRRSPPGLARRLAVLVAATGLSQFTWAAAQQLVLLQLIRLAPGEAATLSGVTLGMAGIGVTAGAVSYSRVAGRAGFRRTALATGALATVVAATLGLAATVGHLVLGLALFGLLVGALNPCLGSMLALQSPRAVQSTVFGINASALAAGAALGPVLSGLVMGATDARLGAVVAAAGTLLMVLLLGLGGREPAPG